MQHSSYLSEDKGADGAHAYNLRSRGELRANAFEKDAEITPPPQPVPPPGEYMVPPRDENTEPTPVESKLAQESHMLVSVLAEVLKQVLPKEASASTLHHSFHPTAFKADPILETIRQHWGSPSTRLSMATCATPLDLILAFQKLRELQPAITSAPDIKHYLSAMTEEHSSLRYTIDTISGDFTYKMACQQTYAFFPSDKECTSLAAMAMTLAHKMKQLDTPLRRLQLTQMLATIANNHGDIITCAYVAECLLPLKVDPITFVQQHNLGVPELNNHRALCDRLDRLYRYRLQTSGAPRPHMTHPWSHRQHTTSTFAPAEPARPGRGGGRGGGRRSGRPADSGRSVPRPPRDEVHVLETAPPQPGPAGRSASGHAEVNVLNATFRDAGGIPRSPTYVHDDTDY